MLEREKVEERDVKAILDRAAARLILQVAAIELPDARRSGRRVGLLLRGVLDARAILQDGETRTDLNESSQPPAGEAVGEVPAVLEDLT